MSQLMSRDGNLSCARDEEPKAPAAVAPSAALPALTRKSRRSICQLSPMLGPVSSRASLVARMSEAKSGAPATWPGCRFAHPGYNSMRRRQPDPEALVEGSTIQEVCQRHVLRHKAGCVDQDALVVALAPNLSARHQLVN